MEAFHRALISSLCDVMGDSAGILLKSMALKLSEDLVASAFYRAMGMKKHACIDLEELFPNAKFDVEIDQEKLLDIVQVCFSDLVDYLGADGARGFARFVAMNFVRKTKKEFLERLNKFFEKLLEMSYEKEDGKIRIEVRPHTPHAAKLVTWIGDIPLPVLILALTLAEGKDIELRKFVHKENQICIFEFELI